MYSDAEKYICETMEAHGYTRLPQELVNAEDAGIDQYHNRFDVIAGEGRGFIERPHRVNRDVVIELYKDAQQVVDTDTGLPVMRPTGVLADELDRLTADICKSINAKKTGETSALWKDVKTSITDGVRNDATYYVLTITLPITFTV